jgi:hypothetical protein
MNNATRPIFRAGEDCTIPSPNGTPPASIERIRIGWEVRNKDTHPAETRQGRMVFA